MEISFKTKDLRTVFESTRKAKSFLGEDLVVVFQTIVADLSAAPTLNDFPHSDMIEIDRKNNVGAIRDLTKFIIFFEIVGEGSDDWTKIMRIKIVDIKK